MIYEDENRTREKLYELRQQNTCAECGGMLNVFMDFDRGQAFLACSSNQAHEGIAREAPPPFEPNIPTRRKDMEEQLGKDKTTKLMKYEGIVSLSRVQATEILETIWPDAPEVEVLKAAMVCAQYGLNPLMRHIFLIPFKKRNKKGEVTGVEWVIVRGIGADRLLAHRRHRFSYLDLSPRRMTEEEQKKVLGEVDNFKIWAITKLKDMDTGAEAMGIGSWPVDEEPYGADKGNTKLNMACIHSERQALDRQYPGEMPQGVEVMEEKYIDTEYTLLDEGEEARASRAGGEKAEKKEQDQTSQVEAGEAQQSDVKQSKVVQGEVEQGEGERREERAPETKVKTQKSRSAPPAETVEGEGFHIDLTWLTETIKQIKWNDETARSWLLMHFHLKDVGPTLTDVISKLTRQQAEEFVNELERRRQPSQEKMI